MWLVGEGGGWCQTGSESVCDLGSPLCIDEGHPYGPCTQCQQDQFIRHPYQKNLDGPGQNAMAPGTGDVEGNKAGEAASVVVQTFSGRALLFLSMTPGFVSRPTSRLATNPIADQVLRPVGARTTVDGRGDTGGGFVLFAAAVRYDLVSAPPSHRDRISPALPFCRSPSLSGPSCPASHVVTRGEGQTGLWSFV